MTTEKTPEEKQADDLAALAGATQAEDFTPGPEHTSAPAVQEKPRLPIGDMLAGVMVVAFNLVAARRGDHWKLKPEEAEELGGALGDVADHYFPQLELGPLPVLGGVAAMVIVPRVMHDQALLAKDAEKEQGAASGDQ